MISKDELVKKYGSIPWGGHPCRYHRNGGGPINDCFKECPFYSESDCDDIVKAYTKKMKLKEILK